MKSRLPLRRDRKNKYGEIFKWVSLGVMLSLLCLFGWWSGEQHSKKMAVEMREDLLRNAVELSSFINLNLVRKLTFTPEDKDTPAYTILCEQLVHASKTFAQRGIYSMTLREGKIFFGPESYPRGDPMARSPGTEYEKPSADDFLAFRNKRPVMIGPTTDEYGTFVTALVPILDPKNGQLLMMLGVDVLASDWQSILNAERVAPFFRVFFLALVIMGGVIPIHRRNKGLAERSLHLKAWVITPVVLVVLGAGLLYGAFEYHELASESKENMLHITEQVRYEWEKNMLSEAKILQGQLDRVESDAALLKAWRARDLGSLSALAQPILGQLNREYGISHFYFIEPDRTCFFRAHQPGRRGDLIDRFTLLTAERSGEDSWGIELGPLGALTLRYVRPVRIEGKLIGYLELGMESEKFSEALSRETGMGIVLALQKKYTTQEKFEAGRKTFDFSGEWQAYPDFVIAHQTIAALPLELRRQLSKGELPADKRVFSARDGDKRFMGGVLPLFDVAGHDVARLFILCDTTSKDLSGQSSVLFSVSFFLVLSCGLLLLLGSVVGAAEKQLDLASTQLQESSESYRRQFYENSAIMFLLDPKTLHIEEANEAACKFYGYPRERFLQMCMPDINTLPLDEVQARMTSAMSQEGKQTEFEHRLADGTLRDVSISSSLIKSGERTLLHEIIHDISDRKNAENLLRDHQLATMNILEDTTETNEKLRKYTEELTRAKTDLEAKTLQLQKATEFLSNTGAMAKVGGWALDLTTQEFFWTDEMFRIHGVEVGTVQALEAGIAYYAPQSRSLIKEALRKAAETGESFDLELELVPAKAERRIWVRVFGKAVYAGDKIVKLEGTCQDIDVPKKAAAALLQSEERLRSITDSAQDAILMMDPKGNISFWNPAAERILCYRSEEVLGRPLHQLLVPSRFQQAHAGAFPEFQKTGKGAAVGKTLELAAIRKDGVEIPVDLSLSAIHRDDGWNAVGLLRDISERKEAEKKLKGLMNDLADQSRGLQKANDGIMALYQELEKKNAELAKLDQLKNDFVSIVAHELRNPLMVIREAAVLILDGLAGPVDAEQKVFLTMMQQTSDQLVHITNDLLDLAKIESGKIVINFEKIDLCSLAKQSCDGIRLRAQKKGIAILQDFHDPKVEIAGDFDKLTQVMTNLLSNAFKFTKQGSITVEIKDLGEEVRCAVKDTGSGISEEDLVKLFSKFVQFGKRADLEEKGTGLGLVISKSIVEAHGGRMGVESKPGTGSTFFFILPKQQPEKKRVTLSKSLVPEKTRTPEERDQALRKQKG